MKCCKLIIYTSISFHAFVAACSYIMLNLMSHEEGLDMIISFLGDYNSDYIKWMQIELDAISFAEIPLYFSTIGAIVLICHANNQKRRRDALKNSLKLLFNDTNRKTPSTFAQ